MRCTACNIILKSGREMDRGLCEKCNNVVRYYENDSDQGGEDGETDIIEEQLETIDGVRIDGKI